MAKHVEQQNVIEMQCAGAAKQAEMQCAGAAKQAEEQKKKNREIILKLTRSIYSCLRIVFLNQPHTRS